MASTPFIGLVLPFAFDFAPKGWAMCQGQLLPINQYQALFALVGTTYGGNGTTNFGLPNLQGRAARGYGQGPGLSACTMGQVAGTETITLTVNNLPNHTHVLTSAGTGPKVSSQIGTSPSPSSATNVLGALNDPNLTAVNNFYNSATPNINLNTGYAAPALANNGGNQPVNIMQPYIALNYCIALVGIFPSRN